MTEKEFLVIVDSMCRHPRLYTRDGTFIQVVIFLEGFALGADIGHKNAHSRFTPFRQWFAERFTDMGITKGSVNWDEFYAMFGDDNEALSELAKLYREYTTSL